MGPIILELLLIQHHHERFHLPVGPLHPAVGALAATRRGWRNIALEGFSEDDNQDGFVDPIGAAVVKVAEAPKVEAKATPVLTYAAPHVYTGYTVAHTPAATVPLTYTHTVPAGVITHPYAYGFPYGYAVAAPAKTEEAAETITEA